MNSKLIKTLILIILYLGMCASFWLMFLSIYEPPFLAFSVVALAMFIIVFYIALKHEVGIKQK